MKAFSIIVTGDEVLNCTVMDENGFWLCKKLTELGLYAKELLFIRDSIDSISDSIKKQISENVDLVIITGGLGPTYDDITLKSISRATSRPLKLNEKAYEMVKSRYEDLQKLGIIKDGKMNKNREKMAMFPEDGEPIKNPAGAAPGMKLKINKTLIIALPGVPSEIRAMFDEIEKIIKEEFGNWYYLEKNIIIGHRDESSISDFLENISKKYNVYIKSRSSLFEGKRTLIITIALRSQDKDSGNVVLENVINELKNNFEKLNIDYHIQ